jgi:PAS domain S-box-containing protein
MRRLIHELDVHRVELELQNEELRRAQGDLEEARDRYLDLYESAPLAYLTLDPAGIVLDANITVQVMLAIERDDLVMQKLAAFMDARDLETFAAHLRQVFKTEGNRVYEVRLRSANGRNLRARIESRSILDEGGHRNRCRLVLVDISDLWNAQKSLELYQRELRSMTSRLMETQRRQSCELARQLHDGVTQMLVAAKMKLEALRLDEPTGKAVNEIVEIVDESLASIRSMILELSPPILQDLGLVPAIRWLAKTIEKRFGLKTSIKSETVGPLAEQHKTLLYRGVR